LVKQVSAGPGPHVHVQGAPSLPRVLHEAPAAILLVDLARSTVVYANPAAIAMSGDQSLPMPVDEWGRRAGLVDPAGADLADSSGPLSQVARGEPVAGEMVRRLARRSQGEQDGAALAAAGAVVPDDAVEPLWVTGFALGPGASGDAAAAAGSAAAADVTGALPSDPADLTGSALVVFLRVSPQGGPAQHGDDELLHNRAVIATELSFTISDPRRPDNPLVWVNPAFTRVTGYPVERAVGRNCRFLQGPGTDEAAVDELRRGMRERVPVTAVLLNYRADGTAFWNEVSLSPVFDAGGGLVNFVGIQSDVTARMEAEEARARAYAAEQQARMRLAHLADVAEAVSDLDTVRALGRFGEVLVRDLVGWAVVLQADTRLTAVAWAGTPVPPSGDGHPLPRPGDQDPLARLLLGEHAGPVPLHEVVDDLADPRGGALRRWLAEEVCHAPGGRCTALPIPGRRRVLGLLVVGPRDGALGEEDLALLRESSRRVGLAMDNARLYEREHQLAEALQRSMLPEQVSVPGLDVWCHYQPNVEHAQVGGDWYDVMQPGTDDVGVVVGDVVGHDIEAAAAMGQLRSVVRAYAYEREPPGAVLRRVDQLVTGMRLSRSASLVYLHLQRLEGGGWELAWARAGHLPPILVRADGSVETLMDGGGPMVGIGNGERATSTRLLQPGDVVICYTDGLIERRARPMMDGLRQLQGLCGALGSHHAAGVGEQLLRALGEAPEDDMAVVVLRIPEHAPRTGGMPTEPRQRRWQLPGEPTSIGRARRLVLQACEAWDIGVAGQAELVVSELVANAVLHGWGPVGLRLEHLDGTLVVEVADGNPRGPAPSRRTDEVVVGGYGLHVVDRLAEWGWRRAGDGKVVWARLYGPD
jgi:PAS domain S-box-containing protein